MIPSLKMPTDDELRESAREWLAPLRPCLYEHWPQALRDLSFKTEVVPLVHTDIEALLGTFDGKYDWAGLAPVLAKIDVGAARLEPGYFARLNSRSPKDYKESYRCFTANDVIRLFSGSMRMLEDLCRWKYLDGCSLLLREFHTIPREQEWRCFVRGGTIAGVSQYEYHDEFPGLADQKERVLAECAKLLPALHLDTVVLDVWLGERTSVIEINPYGLPDPCLFTYEELEAARGEVRVRDAATPLSSPR